MATEGWDIGDTIRLKGAFTVGNTTVLGDPTSVYLYVRTPTGTVTEYTYGGGTVTKSTEASGTFYRDYSITESGLHRWRMKGTGAVATAGEATFEVRPQLVST